MPLGDWLQVIGGVIELIGLGTVALGIREARLGFDPTRPSLPDKGRAAAKRVAARFRKPQPQNVTLDIASAIHATTGMNVRARVSFGPWDDVTVEDRIERLKQRVEAYQDRFDILEDQLEAVDEARTEGEQGLARRMSEVEERLGEQVKQAATGGLGRETWGVLLFGLGLVLQVWGSIIT